jgi:DNA-binding response OmpR family regulator
MRVRVLVVDPEINARRALKELLTDEGYDVITSAGMAEALPHARRFRPHVTLLDDSSADDQASLRSLRALGSSLIEMSARSAARGRKGALLGKPIELGELFRAVAEAAQRTTGPSQLR